MNHTLNQKLDIVLPCYNPLPDWTGRIIESYQQLSSQLSPTTIHLIIVNDGSNPPISPSDIDKLKNQVSHFSWVEQRPNQGKGAALRAGMKHVSSSHVIFTDIDFPYTLESTLAICRSVLNDEADIVVGQRKKRYYDKTPVHRKWVSKILKKFNRYALRIPVSDTQCGLKGFNRKGLEVFMDTSINRYLFDLEFLIKAGNRKNQLSIKPIDVELRDGITFSKLNWKIMSTEMANVLKIAVIRWFG